MKLLVATRSAGKQQEVRQLLDGTGVELTFPAESGIPDSAEERALELHPTFEANARAKAEYFARRTGLPTVADDSGLEVIALGGEPGVRSRRWSGAAGTEAEVDAANNALLLHRLLGAPAPRRRARYRCVLAYVAKPGATAQVFEGVATGSIATEARGMGGFGYDPLFVSDELDKTFGEATPEEKHAVSHRGRAFAALLQALQRSP